MKPTDEEDGYAPEIVVESSSLPLLAIITIGTISVLKPFKNLIKIPSTTH
jgi:hypothetical protein